MNSIIDSNNNSQFFQTLWIDKKKISQPHEYKIIGNFPNGAKSIVKVTANQSGTILLPAGLEIVFPIPKISYYLQFLAIRTLVITAADEATHATIASEFGLRLYSRTELRAHGKVFWKSDTYNNQVYNDLDNFEKSQAYSCLSEPLATNNGAAPVFNAGIGFYVTSPVYAPYFEKSYMNLDTVFLEPMECAVIVESQVGLGLASPLASILPAMYAFYRAVDNDSYVITKQLNFTEGQPTTILASTTYTEAVTLIADDATSTDIYLRCKNVAQSTSFFLTAAGNVLGSKKMFGDPTHCIYKFDMTFSGQAIFSGIPTDMIVLDRAYRYSSSNILCTNVGTLTGLNPVFGPFTLYWSDDSDRTYNSYGLAYYNGGQPILTIYHPDLGANAYSCVVVHSIMGFLTIDSSNGTLELSLPT